VAAQPTRYAVCIVKGIGCVPPGAPPQLTLAPSVTRLPRRDPHRDPTLPPAGMSLPLSNGRISSPHR